MFPQPPAQHSPQPSTARSASVPACSRCGATCRTPDERDRAAAALRLLGPASVRLLAVEGDVLVLERVRPGTSAADLPDDERTAVLAAALPRLWAPVPPGCPLPTIEQECRALDDERVSAALPPRLLAAASDALAGLLADAPGPVVLHGDLHAGNVLRSARRGWVAVDPHGLVGDPAYDVGPLLVNLWSEEAARLLPRRPARLAELLPLPAGRLAGWGLVRAVLAEAWHVQDTGAPHGGPLAVARALAQR